MSAAAFADPATSAYQSGQYAEAISQWEAQVQSTPSADGFYNLGNAYFKNNQVGESVAAYFAARSLAPRDPDVVANLNFVRARVGDKLENHYQRPTWQKFFAFDQTINLKEQFWTSVLLILFGCLAVGARWWLPRAQDASTWGGVILLTSGLWLGFGASLRLAHSMTIGAVTASSSEIRAEKGNVSAPVLFQLTAGTPVLIVSADEAWARVALPDGKGGWLPRSEVAFFTL